MPKQAKSPLKPLKRRTDEKLDLDDLIAAPNLGGMLSFLDVPPDEARRRHNLRRALDQREIPTETEPVHISTSVADQPIVVVNNYVTDDLAPTVGASTPGAYNGLDTHRSRASIDDGEQTTEMRQPTVVQRPSGYKPVVDFDALVPSPSTQAPIPTPRQATDPYDPAPPAHRSHSSAGNQPYKAEGVPATVVLTPTVRKRERIFRATLVQHGHSPAEQLLYQALWNHGAALADGSRQITAGYRELGYMTNLNDKTIKYNLQSLQTKLAIQTLAPENTFTRTGRTYKVFSYDQILQRRSQAGLVWVKKTKGVEFVLFNDDTQAADGEYTTAPRRATVVLHSSATRRPDIRDIPQESEPTVPESSTGTMGSIGTDTGVPATRQLGREKETFSGTTTPTADLPLNLTKTLSRIFPAIDHSAVENLWKECWSRAADCTSDEVIYFVNQKLPIARSGRIQNPVGFLIATVPKCFEGETFQIFRQEQARRKEEQRRREEEEHRKQRQWEEEAERYRREEEASRQAEQLLPTLSAEARQRLYAEAKNDLLAKGYKTAGQTMENLIKERMIRNLAKRILSDA